MTESVSDDPVDNGFSTDFTIGPVQGLTEIRQKRVESAGANALPLIKDLIVSPNNNKSLIGLLPCTFLYK